MTRLTRILVHTAIPILMEDSGEWVEGERIQEVVDGTRFPCVVFPPGTREGGRSGRRIESPLMLIDGINAHGEAFTLKAEDHVRIVTAPGLAATELGEYQVDGTPLALGRPGISPEGFQVNLKRVRQGV